jgi:DNA topoisomerase I
VGRYGAYLQRGTDTASIPDDLAPDELSVERALELISRPSSDRELGKDPATDLPIYVKNGRFGAYVQLGEAGGKERPKTCSLLRSMTPDTVTLEDALRLLSLPRTLGTKDGQPVTAQLGRYGPYVSCGSESRSLDGEDKLFTATLEDALVLLAAPRQRGMRRTPEPLRTIGDDPTSKKPITVRDGRFGPYVTDGETHASLRKGDSPESVTLERAIELLEERRARGPSMKRSKGRRGASAPAAKAGKTKKAKGKAGAKAASSSAESGEAPQAAPKSKAPKKKGGKRASKSAPRGSGGPKSGSKGGGAEANAE